MTELQQNILKYKRKIGVTNCALIAKLLCCREEYVRRFINQYNNKVSDPRRDMKIKVEAICPKCRKRHMVTMTSKPIIVPRVYCDEHDYLRYKPEGFIYSIGYGDSREPEDQTERGEA